MKESYPVSFENYDKIEISAKGFVEITAGPTGLMMIKRGVFDKLKEDNPDLDLRMVFQSPYNKISKRSKTTYAKWCEKHGIPWCAYHNIPIEWLT